MIKNINKYLYLAILLSTINPISVYAEHKVKTRSESFWGIHFDKHSNLNDRNIGKTLTEGMIDSMLTAARPDFIQVDSKGHPGICSYMTKIGQRAAGYTQDPLRLFRKVTWKHNVALYVHHSGVFDANYVRLHPSECRVGVDGKIDKANTSLWGNYVDSLLIPQLKELALEYKVDGAWIDGETWAVYPDYHPLAKKDFMKTTGIKYIPTDVRDPNYKIFLEFNRKKFINYIRHYTAELKEVAPNFQICSNWAFSAMMPEEVPDDIKLSFLSGDYDPDNSLNTANWHARCLAKQKLPFDLMSWSFARPSTPKSALQLCQEASSVISIGGGCNMYFRQNEDLSLQPASFKIMKEVADFVLPRREFCKGINIIPQIGLFYSTQSWKSEAKDIYRPFGFDEIRGVLDALLDGQQSVEVLMTHHIRKDLHKYPFIVVPEWTDMEKDVIVQLKEYVKQGGKLLVIGEHSTKCFDDILGIESSEMENLKCIGYNESFITLNHKSRKIVCNPKTEILATAYKTNDFRFPAGAIATKAKYGKGEIAGIYTSLGELYLESTSPVLRDLLSDIINDIFSKKIVSIKGSHKVNVVTAEKNGKLLIQLVNTSGDHANRNVKNIDEIPVLSNLQVSIKTDHKPTSVKLQPIDKKLEYRYDGKKTYVNIPSLPIHYTLEIK